MLIFIFIFFFLQKDQVLTLQVEIEDAASGFEKLRQDSLKQVKDLKERVTHFQTEVGTFLFLLFIIAL